MPNFFISFPLIFCVTLLIAHQMRLRNNMVELPRQESNTECRWWSIEAGPREAVETMNGKGARLFWPLRRKNSSSGRFLDAPPFLPLTSSSLWLGKSEEGKLYEDTMGYYVHATFSVYSTAVTLVNYSSNKLLSMALFNITVILGLPDKNHGKWKTSWVRLDNYPVK